MFSFLFRSYMKWGWLKNPNLNLYLLFDGKQKKYVDENKVIPPLCSEKGHRKGLTKNDGGICPALFFLFSFCWVSLYRRLVTPLCEETWGQAAGRKNVTLEKSKNYPMLVKSAFAAKMLGLSDFGNIEKGLWHRIMSVLRTIKLRFTKTMSPKFTS